MDKLLESMLNQVLTPQVTEQLGADRYERTGEKQAYRNGSYERKMKGLCLGPS